MDNHLYVESPYPAPWKLHSLPDSYTGTADSVRWQKQERTRRRNAA